MSLYDICYVSRESQQARLKQQQFSLQAALKELSVSSRQEQQKEHEKLVSMQHVTNSNAKKPASSSQFDLWLRSSNYPLMTSESQPYSPYTYTSTDRYMSSSVSTSTSIRQRTPSMVSASSSYASDSTTNTSYNNIDGIDGLKSVDAFDLSERDAYGFKRPVQWVQASKLFEFEERYKLILQKQAKSWKRLLANNGQHWPDLCPELNRYVRKGIPQSLRADAWMHYSGAKSKLQQNRGIYQSLVDKAQEDNNEYADAIAKDLHRTFPNNTFFACDVQHEDGSITMSPDTNEKLQMLRRVLLAFSVYSPEIGYCQSLNFLAGFMLLFLGEEEAFWLLVNTVHEYFPKSMFDTTMEGANIEQTVLMSMIYDQMPGVWSKIGNKKCFWDCEQNENLPSITLVTSHWFLTLFINILPVETILRIFDCFFVGGGSKVLYQVALTIIKLNEQRIWNASDSVDTFQILQNMPKRLFDCDQFMKCVFSPNNDVALSVAAEDIQSKRELFKKRKLQRKANQNHPLGEQ